MTTIEYSVENSFQDYPYPVVVKKTILDGEVITGSIVDYAEASAAGVDLEQYFALYKNYVQTYLDSLSTFSNELLEENAYKSQDFPAAAMAFYSFMRAHWAEVGNNVDTSE